MPSLDDKNFDRLIDDIQDCALCPSMAGCTRVLSWANGRPDAPIMFVGEAPGRLGADRTAIPFHGDKSGDNFELLIELAGLNRRDIFVTNAVLCNPKDDAGNNAPPSKAVLRTCAANLERQINIVQPAIVVTLGAAALESTRLVERHELTLAGAVRTVSNWHGRRLIPLYHPGARAMIHRNFSTQTVDYYFVGEQLRRLSQSKRPLVKHAKPSSTSWDIVKYLIYSFNECSLFKLHKSIYLMDVLALRRLGSPVSQFMYVRQKDGPYCVELGSRWFKSYEETLSLFYKSAKPWLRWKDSGLFGETPRISVQAQTIADEIVESVRGLSDSQIKTKSYLTAPMKEALRAERQGLGQLNRPLI